MEGPVRNADIAMPRDMADMDESIKSKPDDQPNHFLVRTDPVDGLMQPVKASTRIKYVCIAVAESCIAMGTNTGVVYVFSRISQRRIHVIPAETDGAIVQISLNEQGNLLAYATGKGQVIISRLYPNTGGHPTRLRTAFEHVGSIVTALIWNHKSDQLFIGDDLGRISVVNFFYLTNNALGSLGPPSEIILRLDSAVVQVDSRGEQLLVSTKAKTVLCDVKKHQFSQIGKRPRDGNFGSCFYEPGSEEAAVIYCSRPGSRLWAVDHEGVVLNTHQFKQVLNKPPSPIFCLRSWSLADFVSRSSPGPQSIAFPKLLLCGEQYLLFCCPKGLFILDPVNVGLLSWTNQVMDAEDICCYKNEVYVLRQNGEIDKLELLTVRELWTCLVSRQQWDLAGWLVLNHPSLTTSQGKRYGIALSLLKELSNKVTASDTRTSLFSLIQRLEAGGVEMPPSTEEPLYDKLDSGIYKIRTQNRETKLLQNFISEPCLETSEKTSEINTTVLADRHEKDVLEEELLNTGDPANSHDLSEIISNGRREDVQMFNGLSCGKDTDTSQMVGRQTAEPATIDAITSSVTKMSNISEEIDEEANKIIIHDPAPVYPASGETRKVKGRKIKPASVGLDSSRKKIADEARKLKKSKVHGHVKTRDSGKSDEALNECTENKGGVIREHRDHSLESLEKSSGVVTETAFTNSPQGCSDIPVISEQFTEGAETKVQLLGDVLREAEIPTEQGVLDVDTSAPETSVVSAEDKIMLSTRINFSSVKDRISSKVKSTTMSMIQNIKDKKVQLTRIVSPPEDENLSCFIDNLHFEDQGSELSYPLEPSSEPSQDVSVNGKAISDSGLLLIDVKDLVLATEKCRAKMDDPQVLYRPDAVKAALNSWAMVLNYTLQALLFARQGKEEVASEMEKTEEIPTNPDENQKSNLERKVELSTPSEPSQNSCCEDADSQDQEVGCILTERISLEEQHDKDSDVDLVQPHCSDDEASLSFNANRMTNPDVLHGVGHFEKLMFTQDPFNLPADCHQAASELAQLCLSFSCCGGTSDANPSRELPECDIQIEQSDFDCDKIVSTPKEVNSNFLGYHAACEDQCTRDEPKDKLCIFLRCHFHLFTGHLDETHQVVLRQCKYRYDRWRAFVSCLLELTAEDVVTHQIMDTEVEAAIDFLRSHVSQRGIWVLPSILRLYGMVPQRTLAFCAEIWEHVPPIDIYFLTKMASKVDTHFLLYTQRVLDEHTNPKWTKVLARLCGDDEVRQCLVDSLLHVRPETTTPLSCPCGMPWPGAHLQQWPHEDLLHLIIDQGSCGVMEKRHCWDHGFWTGVIKLCHRQLQCAACREGACDLHQMTLCDIFKNKQQMMNWHNLKCACGDVQSDTSRNGNIHTGKPHRGRIGNSDLQMDEDIDVDSDGQSHKLRGQRGDNWYTSRDALQTIVLQLADINLLHQNTQAGYFPESLAEWEELLQKRNVQGYRKGGEAECIDNAVLCLGCSQPLVTDSKVTKEPNGSITGHQLIDNAIDTSFSNTNQQDASVYSCKPNMTWEALAAILLQEVGLSRGLGVLQRVGVPEGELPMSFFNSCVMSASLQKCQSRLVHNMLERVDTYLWSVRPTTMAPEVSMAVLQEHLDSTPTASTDKMFDKLRGEPIISSSLEDATAGWGVAVDLTGCCCVCTLPFKTMVSPLHTGTIYFKCGHGFHDVCSSRTSCIMCTSSQPVPRR